MQALRVLTCARRVVAQPLLLGRLARIGAVPTLSARRWATGPTPSAEPPKSTGHAPDSKVMPPSRYRGPITWAALGLLALGGAAGIMYYNSEKQKKLYSVKVGRSAGELNLGGPFELIDTEGRTVTDKDFLGRYLLVYFGFTHCPDICPTELTKIGKIMDIMESNSATRGKVQPVFISVDPDRDSAATLKAYAKDWHPSIRYLTGTHDQIKSAARAYRVYYSKPEVVTADNDYLVDHSIIIYFMGPDGKCLNYFSQNVSAELAADRMRAAITGV